MTVLDGKNFSERLVQIRFSKHCSKGQRAEHLFNVPEKKAKKRFPIVCTRTLFMATIVAFCALDTLLSASVSSIQP